MSVYASRFKSRLDRDGVIYDEEENGLISIVFSMDNAKSVRVYVDFDDDVENLVSFGSFALGEFPVSMRSKAIVLCNEMNGTYRWVKFYLNDDKRCIVASANAILDEEICDQESVEYLMALLEVIDEVYPAFMKARWA